MPLRLADVELVSELSRAVECTSACSVEMEQRLFGICNELKLSYITISHRPALVEFHDQMITIGGEGQAGFAHKQLKRNRVASRAGPGERLRDLPAEVSIKRHMEQRSEPYMIVGVDFDNTIVGYDQLFHRVAVERGLVPTGMEPTKSAVRDQLRNTGQEDAWTELQGYVYGARMKEAEPISGALE